MGEVEILTINFYLPIKIKLKLFTMNENEKN